MKRLVTFLVLFFCLSTPCMAEWGKTDTALLILEVVDWGQTRDIATRKCEPPYISDYDGSEYLYHETNPILGKHPSVGRVNAHFASSILINYLVTKFDNKKNNEKFKGKPKKLHKYWNYLGLAMETHMIGRNYNLGIKIKF